MLRKAPSLEATEAFLLAARCASFREAAQQLALSPSAFSRRIQQLERFVGVGLFDRSGPVARLTETGARFLAEIEPAMDQIRRAAHDLRSRGGAADVVRVGVSHSFAVSWLLPRLSAWRDPRRPAVEVVAGRGQRVLRTGEVDLCIWGGHEGGAQDHELLIDLEGVVVCSSRTPEAERPASVEELRERALLGLKDPPWLWSRWLRRSGVERADRDTDTAFDSIHMMYEAAAGGLGLTLGVPLTSERFLRDRRLDICLDAKWPLGLGYYIGYADPRLRARPGVAAFTAWLRGEVEASRQWFDQCWRERGHADAIAAQ